ncbi:hypothetical protein F3J23_14885 [Chryseobacterium sp. Tr-659]|uniref:hypothetical protein n=1 Tax=Chryseobacterium sp. Tr-659 TaxID=2608340 RepID=UPI0014240E48|nr:hypothetical protein [Chryseobacterium sp. Tr-659]NIF06732.1 hypothetical protein [Chryseobacterium sp. Tr-659]
MSWWTGGALGDANTAQEMLGHMLKLGDGNSFFNNIDFSQTTSNSTWWVNTAVGAGATANVPRIGVFKYNAYGIRPKHEELHLDGKIDGVILELNIGEGSK